jgi:ATP-dependent DNA helicase DinG
MEVFLDREAPDPRTPRRAPTAGLTTAAPPPAPDYATALAARILPQLDATDGGAFILFNSFATLRAVARRLEIPLVERRMPMLVHEPHTPRSELLRRFREDPRSVLLGAASFWQGVDVPGQGLRNVIITQLPFEPPDRPLTEARLELVAERGGDPFRDESLPRAVIRFKQGIGRLIRSKTDTGRIVVLDPRIVTKPYGRVFLRAIPKRISQ